MDHLLMDYEETIWKEGRWADRNHVYGEMGFFGVERSSIIRESRVVTARRCSQNYYGGD